MLDHPIFSKKRRPKYINNFIDRLIKSRVLTIIVSQLQFFSTSETSVKSANFDTIFERSPAFIEN